MPREITSETNSDLSSGEREYVRMFGAKGVKVKRANTRDKEIVVNPYFLKTPTKRDQSVPKFRRMGTKIIEKESPKEE